MERPLPVLAVLALAILVAAGCKPRAISGPDRQDYGPTRHPAENAHDYTRRQQGQIGPCAAVWDAFHASYFNWRNGVIPEQQYRNAEQQYGSCVAQSYP